jgi:hypothetical protein
LILMVVWALQTSARYKAPLVHRARRAIQGQLGQQVLKVRLERKGLPVPRAHRASPVRSAPKVHREIKDPPVHRVQLERSVQLVRKALQVRLALKVRREILEQQVRKALRDPLQQGQSSC